MNNRDAQDFALRLAPLTAAVANFCDHAEHNELSVRSWVLDSALALRQLIIDVCACEGLDLVDLYAERLGAIEARNVLSAPGTYDGHRAALEARTWRDLQLVQADHDRSYHPDVIGLAKSEQLRHYALHLSKIVGAFAAPADTDDLLQRRLPDALLFALKLATVMGVRLDDEAMPRRTAIPCGAASGRG